ncbi:uncharacterized protein LOC126817891 [Patella vulgata]|uniref:uncharacterized protein LOC126817891 n=1 Tax=Patella vulgata TaxID=6465 RepID=UPI00217FA8B5|nr:uncharacterized protein LOC126817891 [Patella vulgata]
MDLHVGDSQGRQLDQFQDLQGSKCGLGGYLKARANDPSDSEDETSYNPCMNGFAVNSISVAS